MRDVLLLALLPFMLYAMVQRPFIATGMWLWTALFFPNGWVFGIASSVRYNLLFAGAAFLSYFAYKHKPKVQFGTIGFLVLTFFAWTTLSTMMTVGNPDVSWEIWNRFWKIVLLFVFVILTIKDKLHVDFLIWCVVLSVGFYANLEALKYLSSGGGHKIAGFYGHVLGDRNELSIAFVMTLPFCYYLLTEYGKQSKILSIGLLSTIVLLVVAIVGTMSRGGFVALIALAGYLYLKSNRKILMSLLIVAIVIGMSYVVSSEWSSRIDTIAAADEDQSFMTRVMAWKMSFILAMQNPLFGGGFKSLETFNVWGRLIGDFNSYPWFPTGESFPHPQMPRAAHSVYFQVLGDHGFGGLALYIACLAVSFLKAGKISRLARRGGAEPWIATVATMIQLSIFAFGLGAAALSLAYFDLIFALFGLVAVLELRVLPASLPAQVRKAADRLKPGRVLQHKPASALIATKQYQGHDLHKR